MLIIKPDSLPRLWWLNPWTVCRQLHKNANALKALADRQDDLLRGAYTTRPRWQIVQNESEKGVEYFFHDTDPDLTSGKARLHFHGKAFLYDGPIKYFAFETDPAKAIERVTDLNK
jgi:hypothetical protein